MRLREKKPPVRYLHQKTAGADQGLEKAAVDICRRCQDPTFGSKDHKPGLHESILNTVPTQGKDEVKVLGVQ